MQIGQPYQPPPLPQATLDRAAFEAVVAGADAAGRLRALGAFRPELPRILAASLLADAGSVAFAAPEALGAWLADRAAWTLAAADGEPAIAHDVHTYRDGARLAALHVFPLAQFNALAHAEAPSLLEAWRAARAAGTAAAGSSALERRRAALALRIARPLMRQTPMTHSSVATPTSATDPGISPKVRMLVVALTRSSA
ncbi:MAG: hypothetical protein ABR591_13875, partial [Candidatus Velthaea sp.]